MFSIFEHEMSPSLWKKHDLAGSSCVTMWLLFTFHGIASSPKLAPSLLCRNFLSHISSHLFCLLPDALSSFSSTIRVPLLVFTLVRFPECRATQRHSPVPTWTA